MISRFFIDRPIFANVIAIITVIIGLITMARLPVEQYPQIVPPTVQVSTNYPGANAKMVAEHRGRADRSSRSTASSTCSTCRRLVRRTAPIT